VASKTELHFLTILAAGRSQNNVWQGGFLMRFLFLACEMITFSLSSHLHMAFLPYVQEGGIEKEREG
jgi:hypothetical protein